MANSHEINRAENAFKEALKDNKTEEIKVDKDQTLELKHAKDFAGRIHIKLGKGATLNLYEEFNDSNIFRELIIDVEKDSSVLHGFSNKASRYAKTTVNLQEGAKYNLKGAYYADAIENFIRFETYHKDKSSESNMDINGAAINGAKVICDALVNIHGKAPKSSGHQKLYGLLLDEHSRILSEPILEINNNDVSCSHAASISQISGDIEFYMNSRGLSKEEVIQMFIEGFFEQTKPPKTPKITI